MHGIKIEDFLFRRISHDIIESEPQRQQFVAKRFDIRIADIRPIIKRFALSSELRYGYRV